MIQRGRIFFYRLYLEIITYFKNRRVQASFSSKTSTQPITTKLIFLGAITGLFLLILLLWILIKSTPPSIKIESTTTLPLTENRQDIPNQGLTATATIRPDKGVLKNMESLPFVEKEKKDNEITTNYMRTNGNLINVRIKPFLESDIIARLGEGYIVKKLNQEGDWIYADPGKGFKGWIYYDLLKDATAEDHQSWENNQNSSAVIGLIRRDLKDPKSLETEKEKIKKLLRSWKTAWERKNIDRYMSLYSKAFTKPAFNWESYRKYKNLIFNKPDTISVEIENIKIKWGNYFMIAAFAQKYRSGSINTTTTKMIHFQQEEDGWKIVKEIVIK